MGHILPKWKNGHPKFLYAVQYMAKHKNKDKTLKNTGGGILLIFALDMKQKLAAETFILHSGLKLICFAVHFPK